MKKNRSPANGTVFLVPLPSQAFCPGVLVRANGKGGAYGLFFSPPVSDAASVDFSSLTPDRAILRCKFGDHGLHTGRWPVVGAIPEWNDDRWRLPRFFRPTDDRKNCYVTDYDDRLNIVSEVILPAGETRDMVENTQYGSGILEVRLGKLLQ